MMMASALSSSTIRGPLVCGTSTPLASGKHSEHHPLFEGNCSTKASRLGEDWFALASLAPGCGGNLSCSEECKGVLMDLVAETSSRSPSVQANHHYPTTDVDDCLDYSRIHR